MNEVKQTYFRSGGLPVTSDRDVGYDRIPDGPRTIPAPHKIRCIYPKKSSIATKLGSRDNYIMENKQRGLILSFNPAKLCSNHLSSLLILRPSLRLGTTILRAVNQNTLQIILQTMPSPNHLPSNLDLGFFIKNRDDDRLKHRHGRVVSRERLAL